MGIISGITVYVIIWWTLLFMVLPWGVRRAQQPRLGDDHGAPEKPALRQKFFITSVLAALLWGCVYGVIASDVISFRDMAARWVL